MSASDEGHSYKDKAQKAYAYYKQHGVFGSIQNGWNWLIERPERLTALSTLAIFLATAVGAGVGIAQWRILRGQLQEMRDASTDAKKLIDANVKLADAAQQSAATADKNLIATQRAWVGTIDASITKGDVGSPIKGNVAYINSGGEPARLDGNATEYLYTKDRWNDGSASGVVRRQSFWDRPRLEIREVPARLVGHFMRLADGASSGGLRLSGV